MKLTSIKEFMNEHYRVDEASDVKRSIFDTQNELAILAKLIKQDSLDGDVLKDINALYKKLGELLTKIK